MSVVQCVLTLNAILSAGFSEKHMPAWNDTYSRLKKRVIDVFGFEIVNGLEAIQENYENLCMIGEEPNSIKMLRSLLRKTDNATQSNIDALQRIIVRFSNEEKEWPLPTMREFYSIINTLTAAMGSNDRGSITISVSSPTYNTNSVSLNVIYRFIEENQLKFKLKISVSLDAGKYIWDTGIIIPSKSVSRGLPAMYCKYSIPPDSIIKSVNTAYSIMKKRDYIAMLDLSPAHYHIVSLSKRMGGKFVDEISFKKYKDEIKKSLEYTMRMHKDFLIKKNLDIYNAAIKNTNAFIVSLMLHEKMIYKVDTTEVLDWVPPRMVYSKEF